MSNRPIILQSANDIDSLDTFESVKMTSAQLREGMVLVDELGCPCVMLDHRIGALRGGVVEWMIHDLDTGRISNTAFATTRIPTIPVAVR